MCSYQGGGPYHVIGVNNNFQTSFLNGASVLGARQGYTVLASGDSAL